MSTDYLIACYDCKTISPFVFASGSISYGFKVWTIEEELRGWLENKNGVGPHEGHDLRIVSEHQISDWPEDLNTESKS